MLRRRLNDLSKSRAYQSQGHKPSLASHVDKNPEEDTPDWDGGCFGDRGPEFLALNNGRKSESATLEVSRLFEQMGCGKLLLNSNNMSKIESMSKHEADLLTENQQIYADRPDDACKSVLELSIRDFNGGEKFVRRVDVRKSALAVVDERTDSSQEKEHVDVDIEDLMTDVAGMVRETSTLTQHLHRISHLDGKIRMRVYRPD